MTLPSIFGTKLNSIPSSRVLRHTGRREEREWQQRLGCEERPKIGLVWAGNPDHKNDSNRSIELKQVKRLLAVRDCRFFSLQVGGDVRIESDGIENLAPLLTDLAETAAAISQLDSGDHRRHFRRSFGRFVRSSHMGAAADFAGLALDVRASR
jgi:hypothetical protein